MKCTGDERTCTCRDGTEIDHVITAEGRYEPIIVKGCIWKTVSPHINYFASIHAAYKGGHLLAEGAWEDQPNWYTEMIDLLTGFYNEQERLKAEEREAQTRI